VKSEVNANRLMKKGRWMVTQLDIGTNEVSILPKWDIGDQADPKAFAPATWIHYDGSEAAFKWRFDYYEGTFTFLLDQSVTQDDSQKAYIQCNNLSGSYEILTDKKNLFEFQSLETNGYQGVNVFIQLQPL